MSRSSLVWISLICLMLCPCLVHADSLINPGFETGDISGWTYEDDDLGTSTSYEVVTGWVGQTLSYTPREGSYFLKINGYYAGWVYQDVSLSTGQELSGWAALDNASEDGDPVTYAQVRVFDGQTELTPPWSAGPLEVAFLTSGPWTEWSWTAPHDGTYRLEYYVDAGLAWNREYGLFDTQVGAAPAVPEPGTLALLAMGLPGLVWFRRRRK